jgi:hypothetical protein
MLGPSAPPSPSAAEGLFELPQPRAAKTATSPTQQANRMAVAGTAKPKARDERIAISSGRRVRSVEYQPPTDPVEDRDGQRS